MRWSQPNLFYLFRMVRLSTPFTWTSHSIDCSESLLQPAPIDRAYTSARTSLDSAVSCASRCWICYSFIIQLTGSTHRDLDSGSTNTADLSATVEFGRILFGSLSLFTDIHCLRDVHWCWRRLSWSVFELFRPGRMDWEHICQWKLVKHEQERIHRSRRGLFRRSSNHVFACSYEQHVIGVSLLIFFVAECRFTAWETAEHSDFLDNQRVSRNEQDVSSQWLRMHPASRQCQSADDSLCDKLDLLHQRYR